MHVLHKFDAFNLNEMVTRRGYLVDPGCRWGGMAYVRRASLDM